MNVTIMSRGQEGYKTISMFQNKTNDTKVKEVCSRCGKRQLPDAKRDGATGWVFKINSCACNEQEIREADALNKAQQKNSIDATKAETNNSIVESDQSARCETDTSGRPEEIPELIDDRFQVLEVLGKGGMGTVYKVRDNETDSIFAMKMLQQSLSNDAAALKRFEQEATAAAQLNHPNLVPVYGHGLTKSGQAYLLMDYVEGETLAQVLKRDGALEEKRAIAIFHQVCDTLAHAHEKGIVHRDIKPANIILSKTAGGEDSARVVDFGIAKALPSDDRETKDLTKTGEVFGSPHYMSPEQCLGFMLDQRSDIYSFGCLMYETLTGETPFAGSNSIQLVVKHINDQAKPFSKNLSGTATMKSLQSVTLKCLEKNQVDRFQTFSEIIDTLKKIESGKKIAFDSNAPLKKPGLMGKTSTLVSLGIVLVPAFFYILGKTQTVHFYKIVNYSILSGVVVTAYILLRAARKSFRMMSSATAPRRQLWSSNLCLFAGLAVVFAIPYAVSSCIGITEPAYEPLLKSFLAISAVGLGLNLFCSLAILVCAVGYFGDRSSSRIKKSTPTIKALAITAAILTIALTAFPKQLAFVPADTASMFDYSVSYEVSNDVSRILYRLAHRMNPEDRKFAERCAWLSYSAKDYATAVKEYTLLIDNPDKIKSEHSFSNFYQTRGTCYEHLGNFAAALADYSHDIDDKEDKGSTNSFAYDSRAKLYGKLNRLDDAIADYSKIIEIQPESTSAYSNRAVAYLKMGDPKSALADLERLLKLRRGTYAGTLVLRGYTYQQINDTTKARADYQLALQISKENLVDRYYYPSRAQTANYLGRMIAYTRLEKPEKAIEEFAEAKKKTKSFKLSAYRDSLETYPEDIQHELLKIIPELKKESASKISE